MDVTIMRGMGKTREDMMEFFKIAKENGILLFGSLDTNDAHIYNTEWVKAEPSLMETFVRGGYMPSGSGTYEEGLEFSKMIDMISRNIY